MDSPRLIFRQLYDKTSSTYTYLLADAQTGEAVLIDTVMENVDRDLHLLSELRIKLKFVLDTHIHADHITAAGEIRRRLPGVKAGIAKTANVACTDVHLSETDILCFGDYQIRVLETPGHTDSSLTYLCEGMVFTGDALLIRGCGRTDFQGGSAAKLFESVTEKLFTLPPETRVFPGHDYKGFTSSSIAEEVDLNPRLGSGRTLPEFVKIMSDLKLSRPEMMDIVVPANQSCGQSLVEKAHIQNVTVDSLYQNRSEDVLLIDVRPEDEFNGDLGHIENVSRITLGDDLNSFLQGYERNEPILFVCRSGKRSMQASEAAIKLGFKNVSNLEGGMLDWNQKSLPVEKAGVRK